MLAACDISVVLNYVECTRSQAACLLTCYFQLSPIDVSVMF